MEEKTNEQARHVDARPYATPSASTSDGYGISPRGTRPHDGAKYRHMSPVYSRCRVRSSRALGGRRVTGGASCLLARSDRQTW